ncbi:membrane protein [Tsuneonella deserti]|uniref:Membrane protein n=1 Tax=Tsuneonella deserti TaxID=2035528 RepID=A0ABQ1S4C9_9SPHN|nr:TIGR02587 family membrane protein [Tsuneonella deserti]GGD89156.1 membrane protein [Tsuneonella deserti]
MDVTGAAQSSFERSKFLRSLARAFGGAVLFSLPLMMTMEMWSLGFYLDRTRFVLLLLLTLALLVPLSRVVGFEETHSLTDDLLDALTAWGVGALASVVILLVFGVLEIGSSLHEATGKIALQTVPASLGAILARGQMGGSSSESDAVENDRPGYAVKLLIMLGGAVYFAFNVAPTEEMILISYKMGPWQALALIALSIAMLLAFVFALDFHGGEKLGDDTGPVRLVVRQGLAGYGVAIAVSAYMLWTFGRTEGVSHYHIATMITVLGFPATLGAAAARLIL